MSEALGVEKMSVPLGAPIEGTFTAGKNMHTLLCPGNPSFCTTTAQRLLRAKPALCILQILTHLAMLNHIDVMKMVITA